MAGESCQRPGGRGLLTQQGGEDYLPSRKDQWCWGVGIAATIRLKAARVNQRRPEQIFFVRSNFALLSLQEEPGAGAGGRGQAVPGDGVTRKAKTVPEGEGGGGTRRWMSTSGLGRLREPGRPYINRRSSEGA